MGKRQVVRDKLEEKAGNMEQGKEQNRKERPHFRFEDLEIWHLAKELAIAFHQVADRLEQKKYYRYAEQLRGAGLSLTNNTWPVK